MISFFLHLKGKPPEFVLTWFLGLYLLSPPGLTNRDVGDNKVKATDLGAHTEPRAIQSVVTHRVVQIYG